jgi:hypothetical protein
MPNDPGLAADTATYLEAIAGDNGVHDSQAVFWLSPDIQLTGPVSGIDKADPGVVNTVDVIYHATANGTLPPGTEFVVLELWVANPSLVMAPDNTQSTAHIDSLGQATLAPGGSGTCHFLWTPPPPAAVPATDPQAPGHKCLIARAYGDPLTPSSTNFFAPDDPHVAQHNICIVPCGGPGAATKPAGCGTAVTTANVWPRPQKARIRASLDTAPSKTVREIVIARLKGVKGFQRLAAKGPKSFGFTFADVKARTLTAPRLTKGEAVESEVLLEPGQVITFRFAADLSGGKLGEAHIFHLTHAGEAGDVQGGLTVVLLAV